MSLVLGVMGLPRVEVELLRIIVRLSSNLRARWTVQESPACDLLLVEESGALMSALATSASLVVPMVPRGRADGAGRRDTLARPIYAEELVELLNRVRPRSPSVDATKASVHADCRSASLARWPSQAILGRDPSFTRLAAALSRSTQSAQSLAEVGRVDLAVSRSFLRLSDEEGILVWAEGAPRSPRLPSSDEASLRKMGLLARIRRRLGLG